MDHHDLTFESPRVPHFGAEPPALILSGAGAGGLVDILRRRFRLILACTILCVAAAFVYIKFAPPSYRAAASLRIDDRAGPTQTLNILGLSGNTEVSTEIEMLRSRMLAEDVVDSLGLQLQITKPRRVLRAQLFSTVRIARNAPATTYTLMPAGVDAFVLQDDSTGVELGRVVSDTATVFQGVELQLSPQALGIGPIRFSIASFDDAVEEFQVALSIVRRSREANLVDVSYRGTDPELVRAVPNLLVSRFITDRQNAQQTETRSTARFLREQTAILAGQLQAAEDTLKRFREAQHIVSLSAQASSGVIHLADLRAQRNEFDAERRALAQLLHSAGDSRLTERTAIAFPTLLRNQAGALMLSSLTDLENRRSELLSRRSLQDEDVQVMTRRIDDLRAQLQGIASTYLQGLTNQIAAIDNTLATSDAQLQTIPAKEIRVAELDRTVTGLEQIYTQLQTQLKQAEVAEAAQDPSVRLVDAAVLPRVPISPRPTLSLALALVAGLLVGLSAAVVREYRDGAVHTRQDVLAVTGIPVLGVIPHGVGVARPRRQPNLSHHRPLGLSAGKPVHSFRSGSREEIAEAFVRLATNVAFAGRNGHGPLQVVMVTSALPGEGKTTSAVNLALASVRRSASVLLIDADLRRGAIHELFRLTRAPGFSEVLAGRQPFEDVVRRVEVEQGVDLHVVTMGSVAPYPSQLLVGVDLAELFGKLRLEYELIVIDSSPMSLVADATLLATVSDGVIVVARAGMTVPEALNVTLQQLGNVNAAVVGTVLNDMDYRRDEASRKAYRYHGSYLAPRGN
jgi:capsular exopolysaccharide synthesis family protein